MKAEPVEPRLWRRVDKSGDCWVWTGAKTPQGYGSIYERHGRGVPRTHHLVHRYSWEIANGPIPEGSHVLHRCDNPPCVNPTHLFLGTNADNVADRVAKGRSADMRGERNTRAKLSPEQVAEIRSLYVPSRSGRPRRGEEKAWTRRRLAAEYGVSLSTIEWITQGRSWAHQRSLQSQSVPDGSE